ncbi:MAG: hypothetical protein HRU41_10080 [Saprospiraceae bacterium]|nr:hypothetical protein [Saprospiraceae bacterium]
MRITILLILFLSACSTPNNEKESVALTKEEEEVAKELIQGSFDKIWGGVDSTEIANYHTDDFIILEHGEVWDNDRIKVYIRGQHQRENRPLRKNRMEYISIDKYGASIQMAYHNYAEFYRADTLVGKGQWLESALAVKTDKGWRLKMMHSTRMPK